MVYYCRTVPTLQLWGHVTIVRRRIELDAISRDHSSQEIQSKLECHELPAMPLIIETSQLSASGGGTFSTFLILLLIVIAQYIKRARSYLLSNLSLSYPLRYLAGFGDFLKSYTFFSTYLVFISLHEKVSINCCWVSKISISGRAFFGLHNWIIRICHVNLF